MDAMAALTDPDRPWTRRSFTPLFLEGRQRLKSMFEDAGLTVRFDTAANMIGTLPGDAGMPVLMCGSHSDTVPDGGRFDGIAGVLAGLAALRAMKQAGVRPRHQIELVDFLAEEPSDWGLACVGSRAMAGVLSPADLALTGPGGESLASAIDRMGGDVSRLSHARRADVAGFVELHIEQGPVLETEGQDIAIVTNIAGIARYRVRFGGTAAHAGTAPMTMRADAGLALARYGLALRDSVMAMPASAGMTATIGVQHLEPGGANVVPGAAECIVDMRSGEADAMNDFAASLAPLADRAAAAEGCTAVTTRLSFATPVACDPALQTLVATAAEGVGARHRYLVSGAGHDAAFVARFAPSAMIFIPSRGGRSHCPEEWTDPDALALGADVLLNTLLLRDRANTGTAHSSLKGKQE